jgi:hypothetical protein
MEIFIMIVSYYQHQYTTTVEYDNDSTDSTCSATTTFVYTNRKKITTDTTYTSNGNQYIEQRIENIPEIPKEIINNEIATRKAFLNPIIKIKTIGKKIDNRVFYSIQENRKNLTRIFRRV